MVMKLRHARGVISKGISYSYIYAYELICFIYLFIIGRHPYLLRCLHLLNFESYNHTNNGVGYFG